MFSSRWYTPPALFGSLFLMMSVSPTLAEEGRKLADAKATIIEYIEAICLPVKQEGSFTGIKLEGKAAVEFNSLLKKLINMGFSGAASYEAREYIGVPRADLADENKSVRKCNLEVWKDLKLMIEPTQNGNSTYNIKTEKKSPVIIGTRGDVTINY